MNYEQTIRILFDILRQCNTAQRDYGGIELVEDLDVDGYCWTQGTPPEQRDGIYGHINKAIEALAGRDVINYWRASGGDLDLTLCNRKVTNDANMYAAYANGEKRGKWLPDLQGGVADGWSDKSNG